MKKIFIIIFMISILLNFICCNSYKIIPLKIKDINYSQKNYINNDIRYISDYLYVFTTIDYTDKENNDRGYLYKIIKFNKDFKFINEYEIENRFIYEWDNKYYIIDCNGNIIYHQLDHKIGSPTSSIIEVYDINEKLIKKIDTTIKISAMDFLLDDNILYYYGYVKPEFTDFCIFKDNINKELIRKGSDLGFYFIEADKDNIYMYGGGGKRVLIFKKNEVLNKEKPLAIKKIEILPFFYRNSNLLYCSESKQGGIVKNKIFYQIRFISLKNEEGKNEHVIDGESKTIQTLLIGIDLDKEQLVKEIKINYTERYVNESPNAYDVDNEGNIYILDSKNKNVIKIDKSVKKVEINYK